MFKKLILKLPFVQARIKEAEIVGSDRLGVIKRYEHFKLKEVEDLADEKVSGLLTTVDPKKIVSLDKRGGIVYIGGERADEGRLGNLKAEAEFFLNSDLWHLIYETPKELAQRAMFIDSESLDGLKKGRSILYTLSTQKNILDVFKSYESKK